MLRGLMQETPLLISSLIDYAARYHGETEIVSRTVEGPIVRLTYRSLHARVKRLADALVKWGVRPGDRIATLAWNTHRHLELYYAISGIGAVLHTVNPRLFPEQLAYILRHAEDRLLFFDLTFAPLVEKLVPALPGLAGVVGLGDEAHVAAACGGIPGVRAYEPFIEGGSEDYAWPVLDEATASALCYTSGTTGNPKGVLYSHRSTVLHAFAACAADGLSLSSRDNVLAIVPLFHANAWGVPYAGPMCGAKLVLPGPALDGESLCQLMTAERCNFSLGVPTVWLNFLAFLEKHPERKPAHLRRVVIGGSAAPRAIIERFQDTLGIEVLHLWGMTETSPLGSSGSMPSHLAHLQGRERVDLQVKQGRAFYGVDMKIVDDSGAELPRDGRAFGVLKVRGPWVAARYFQGEGGEILDADGWFATGDVATLDASGYMQITDREKDVIKSGGEWISSIELENAAVAHPAVQEAAVIGVAHPLWVERPLLLVVRRAGSEGTDESLKAELRALLAQKVAKWWLPDDIAFVAELPHTATGKLHKLKLREKWADYKLPTVDAPAKP